MKRFILNFFLCLTVSCSLISSNVSVLDNPTCELPCWNNITPGETTNKEAFQIIKELIGIDVKNIDTNIGPWKVFDNQIGFYLYTDPKLAKVQTDGVVYFIDDKVAALLLMRNIGRTFGEIIELVGEPESIISMPFVDGSTILMAIFPPKGIMIEFWVKSDKLQTETEIDAVMFFAFEYYENLLDASMFSMGHYNANETKRITYLWKGYGNIEELYPPRFP